MDPDFVKKLDECICILEPIEMYIKLFQGDAVPCSDVYKAFLVLEEKMRNMSNISSEKKEYLAKLVRNRFNFMYGDAHGVCYLLDPRYLGDDMTRRLRNEIEDFIYNVLKNDGTTNKERQEQLAREYTAFRIEALRERRENTFRFRLIGQSKSVLQWWKADGTDWPLLLSHIENL
ncbi:transposase putative [Paramuricea clavata]|uniref:Transposase putative n=1 Tax=Paramuricea clavata TaxID=317549 RepID=A0A6S7IQX0_PARCT|nr:transposase putative [Paramuricea clavata]